MSAFLAGFAGAFKALRAIPWQVWVLAALLAAGWVYGERRYDAGQADVQTRWDAAVASQQQAAAKQKEQRAEVTERVVTKYVDRVKTVYVRGQTIVKEVPVYVPLDSPDLPPGFRVLHDAAAQGILPNPAGIPDAPSVPAQDAAATIAENYTTCRATAEQLTALQEWVRGQQQLNQ